MTVEVLISVYVFYLIALYCKLWSVDKHVWLDLNDRTYQKAIQRARELGFSEEDIKSFKKPSVNRLFWVKFFSFAVFVPYGILFIVGGE